MSRTIVLNGDYTFLNTTPVRRAINLMLSGNIEVLKFSDRVLHCSDGSEIKVPLVIRLIKVIRMIYKNKVPANKSNILVRDHHTCCYCGSKKDQTIDHIIPASRASTGKKITFENCVTACRTCNNKKGNRTPSEANMFLRKQPHVPTIAEFIRIKMKNLGVDAYLKELGIY
jgi:5-methylcytosine-specific restriction endonuclease McrA